MPTVSVDGTKSDRYLEQRQSVGRDGINCWMCGVAELGGQNILYYPNHELLFCKQENSSWFLVMFYCAYFYSAFHCKTFV